MGARIIERVLAVAVVAVCATSCAKVDYVGESFAPTSHVDLYFSEDDIAYEFEVMGHMVAVADDFVSAEKMQQKMIQKAMEKGADAIIILGIERYQSGERSEYSETVEEKGGKTKTKATSKTEAEEKKEIRATVIKYR